MSEEWKQGLHRGAKALMDTGEVSPIDEAMAVLKTYRLVIYTGPELAVSPSLQAALLTAVNAGQRACLGGVSVVGCPDAPLLVPLPGSGATLHSAVCYWGGRITEELERDCPGIVLGSACVPSQRAAPTLRASFEGWNAGVAPLDEGWRLAERSEFTPAGVLTGSLAVSECFQHLRGKNPFAMRRRQGLSLWRPESHAWWEEETPKIEQILLPAKLWLIGLGHLGQAYLWTLAMLPYRSTDALFLVLQDFDALSRANLSTSLWTRPEFIGEKKTRRMAALMEARGFRSMIIERPFDERLSVGPDDPGLALCGVDNAAARRLLEAPGFTRVIEAGLGHGAEEYLSFQMHTFPGHKPASEVWRSVPVHSAMDLLKQPAYAKLSADGMDECGVVQIAGCAVGAPFVGATIGALVIAESIRTVMGIQTYEVVDGSLRDLARSTACQYKVAMANNLGYLTPDMGDMDSQYLRL